MKEKIFFMKQALKEAEKAYRKGEVPIGAVIVKDGKIISRGYNLKETKKNTLKHAEIIAIEKASKKLDAWRLEECDIYLTKYKFNHIPEYEKNILEDESKEILQKFFKELREKKKKDRGVTNEN